MTRFEAGVTGSPRDAPEGKWALGGGIEILCTYKVYGRIDQKSYQCKKITGTLNNFLIHCSLLYLIEI